jgi:aspartate carbamoyltransferase catalytic subunit
MRPEVRQHLEDNGIEVSDVRDLRSIASSVDVVYVTRAQTSRFEHAQRFESDAGWYTVDRSVLDLLPSSARVLHPLPRGNELPTEVDDDPRVVCFRQAGNGLFIRMALLAMLAAR